jgi:hypothetical protein
VLSGLPDGLYGEELGRRVEAASGFIRERMAGTAGLADRRPQIVLVLGSGLGEAAALLDREPRLRASILVPAHNPDLAVAEIERVAPDRRFVQVLLLAMVAALIVGRVAEPAGEHPPRGFHAPRSPAVAVRTRFFGGSVFGAFLLLSGIPHTFAAWVTDLGVPPYMIVWLILLGFVALGTFLDGFSTMLIAVPLTHPVVTTTLGYDPLLFGILVIKAIEIGLITPPEGINAYVISGISKTPVERVFQGLLPFYIADVATIGLLFAFPWLVTALPTLMRG